MSTVEPSKEAVRCSKRIIEIRKSLFGQTIGNKYRRELASLRATGQGAVAVSETRRLLIEAVFRDPSMAFASLSQLARKSPRAATIFMALDLAHGSLMNPTSPESQDAWVRDMTRVSDAPMRLVLDCLETLERTLNDGELVGVKKPTPRVR